MAVVDSSLPRRKQTALVAGACITAGVALAYAWSYRFVDEVVAGNIASALLSDGLLDYPLVGISSLAVFAFVSGLAGTFTACNVCVLSAALPLAQQSNRAILTALWPFLLTLVAVSGTYGAVGVHMAPNLPQLSQDTWGTTAMPLRLIQAGAVFVLIGFAMLLWGFEILRRRGARGRTSPHSVATQVALGAMVAAFQIGRPFPPFRRMFTYAAEQGDALMGALAFILQAAGNIALLLVFVVLLSTLGNGAAVRWMTANPYRRDVMMSVGFIVGGAFMVAYWGVRIPARFYFGV